MTIQTIAKRLSKMAAAAKESSAHNLAQASIGLLPGQKLPTHEEYHKQIAWCYTCVQEDLEALVRRILAG